MAHCRSDSLRCGCRTSTVGLREKLRISLLLAGDHLTHDERGGRSQAFLYGGASGLSHDKMAGGHPLREILHPSFYLDRAGQEVGDLLHRFAEFLIATTCSREFDPINHSELS